MWQRLLKNNSGLCCSNFYMFFSCLVTTIILFGIVIPNIAGKIASGIVLIFLLYVYKKAWDRFKKEEEESAKKYELEREAEEKAKKYNLNPTLFAMSALDQEKQNQDS